MKRIRESVLSILLILVLFASSFVPTYAAESSEPSKYSTEYNSGTRGVVCTTLDGTSASSYYKNYQYDDLSTLSANALFSTLQSLMRSTHTYISSYDDCHYKADRTDCQNGDGSVSLIYTGYSATMSQWNGWNREHIWPQSLGAKNTTGGGADLHHIRPSDAGVNSSRGNKPYGEAGSGASEKYGTDPAVGVLGGTYNSTYFEPLDNVKGDVARICLYMYVRWNSDWGADSVTEVFQSVDVLLAWCEADPVDTWEMGRNEVVGAIQGNRNVFIDYPEYAWLIFGEEVPDNMQTPSGEAMGTNTSGGSSGGSTGDSSGDSNEEIVPGGSSGDSSDVETGTATLTFDNTSKRTAFSTSQQIWEENGITFTNDKSSSSTNVADYSNPVRLYSSSKVTVERPGMTEIVFKCNSSEYATALKNSISSSNNYTVSISGSDVTVSFNSPVDSFVISSLAAQVRMNSLTVTYGSDSGGEEPDTPTCEHTDTTTNTTAATCTVAGYVVVICVDCSTEINRTTLPATGHQNTTETTTSAGCTTEGSIVVTCNDCGATVSTETLEALGHNYVDGTCSECGDTQSTSSTTTVGIIIADYADANNWVNGTKYLTVKIDDNISIVASGGDNTGKYYTSGENWRIYQSESGKVTFTASNGCTISTITITYAVSSGGVLVVNGTNVSSGTTVNVDSNTVTFSVGNSGSATTGQARITAIEVVYSTPNICEHSNTTTTTVAASCTTDGSVVVTCTDCGDTVSTETLEALGHNYVDGVCTRCGNTLPVAYFKVPSRADGIPSAIGPSVTMPDAPVLANVTYDRVYTFIGWALAAEDGVTVKPTIYTPGQTVQIAEKTVFYAVYSYTTTSTTSTQGYVKKDINEINSTDKVVITVTKGSTVYALYNANGTSSAPTAKIISVSGNKISGAVDDTLLWNISNSSGNLTIYPNGTTAKWLYCTATNNGVRVGTNSNKIFTIDSTSGYLKNTATSRYVGVYTTNPDWRCYTSYSGSSNIAGQTLAFYVYTDESVITETVYYTTTLEVAMGFTGASLNIGSDLSIRYHVVLNENPEDYTVRFTMNDKVMVVSGVEENGKYVFSFCGIAPQCMGDIIKAELLLNGDVVDTIEEYSVKQYVIDSVAYYPDNTYLHQLLYDMLVYGSEAQKYRGYKLDALVTDGVVGLTPSKVDPTDDDNNRSLVTANGADTSLARFFAAGVRFDYDNKIYVKISTESIDRVKITVAGEELELISLGNNTYIAYSSGISALYFDEVVAFELTYDDSLIQTLTYTVNTYAWDKQENAEIGDLALALYRYGISAKAYENSKA